MLSQNRINSWDMEKITSIEIEHHTTNNEKSVYVLESKPEMDTVMDFLRQIDFKELDGATIENRENNPDWKFKIICHGLRDWVFLFDNYAFIGKTTFAIDKTVVSDFEALLLKL